MYRAKGQLPPSAPPSLAAAAVLGQTGLWGRLMGGPETLKPSLPQETDSTDGEDEVRFWRGGGQPYEDSFVTIHIWSATMLVSCTAAEV